jgi:myosin heavy subunit
LLLLASVLVVADGSARAGSLMSSGVSASLAAEVAAAQSRAQVAEGTSLVKEMAMERGVAKDSPVDLMLTLLRNMKSTLHADFAADRREYIADSVACVRNRTALESIITLNEEGALKTTDEEFDITLKAVKGSVSQLQGEVALTKRAAAEVRATMKAREEKVTKELQTFEMRVAEHENALRAIAMIRSKLRRVRGFGEDDAADAVAAAASPQQDKVQAQREAGLAIAPVLMEMRSYAGLGAHSEAARAEVTQMLSALGAEVEKSVAPAMVATTSDRARDMARLLKKLKESVTASMAQLWRRTPSSSTSGTRSAPSSPCG